MEKLGKGISWVMDLWAKVLAIVGSITLTVFFFAVPKRLLWDKFEDFITDPQRRAGSR